MKKAWTLTAEVGTARTVAEAARTIRKRGGSFALIKLEGLLEAALVVLKEEGLDDDVRELVHAAATREDVRLKKSGRGRKR